MVAATGLGSLPGTDVAAAVRMTFDKLPRLPYLPELPARGPWAALLGRGLGLPSALPAEFAAGEWRLADAPGIDQRRARATWRDDLDRLEEEAQGFTGRFKVAVTGPWTLAASLGVAHVGRVLADTGARRDLAQALADGVGELFADVSRRFPAWDLVLQVDEPSLPAVAAGAVPTPGGFFRHRAVDLPELCRALGWITAEPARRGLAVTSVLHSCGRWDAGWPAAALAGPGRDAAGFTALSFDLDQLHSADLDALAAAADSGTGLWLGCLPTGPGLRPLGVDAVRRRALDFLDRLGAAVPTERLVLTPACGLAGWTATEAARGLEVLTRVADQVAAELS